jgi:hypothetical protein
MRVTLDVTDMGVLTAAKALGKPSDGYSGLMTRTCRRRPTSVDTALIPRRLLGAGPRLSR